MKINKKDMILIGGVLLLALIFWLIPFINQKKDSLQKEEQQGMLKITVDGKQYGTYSLSKDRTIEINDTNICEIKDGKVTMTEADCPDKLCIHQKAISTKGGTIVLRKIRHWNLERMNEIIIKKTAYLGIFSAIAIIFGYVESLFPLGIPGVKLGLANLVIVFLLYLYGVKEAVAVSFVRILVIGFLFGNLFSILFSLAGAVVSLGLMVILKKTKWFSVVGVSVAGGVSHNIAQIIVASFVVGNLNLFWYLPVLLVSGVIAGFLMGTLATEVLNRIQLKKDRTGKDRI